MEERRDLFIKDKFNMRITIVLALTLFWMVFLGSCNTLYATEDIGESRISPASPIYFLKTIRESIELKFAATPRVKMIRELEFATRRLREVKSLIPTDHQDLIEPTLERYWYHLQNLPEKLELETLAIHLETLERVYNQVSNTRAKMAMRAAINRLVNRADLPRSAKLPACTFLINEASSSSLTEVEKAILLERAQKCFKSIYLNPLPNL